MLALRQGRYPVAAGEVALTHDAMDLLSTSVGRRVMLGGLVRTVVGRVENPGDLSDDFALIAPGQTSHASSLTILLASTSRGGDRAAPRSGTTGRNGATGANPRRTISFGVMLPGDDRASVLATVLAATTLMMTLVSLISAAGFIVLAQRRQRQLGLLAAIGASERNLRLVMLASGAMVGVASAVTGAALGLLAWMVAAPVLEGAVGHRIDRLDLPWGLILVAMGLAVMASIAAAWWPARTMARQSVMSALSRRPNRPASVHRSLVLAAVFILGGLAGIAQAHATTDHVRPLFLILGMVAVVIGVVLASPAAVRLLAFPAGRLPFAPRLALRDLVRHQARAASALAAITLALSISVAVVIVAKASEPPSNKGNLSNRELLIRVGDRDTGPDASLSPGQKARLDASARAVATAAGEAKPITLDVAVNSVASDDPSAKMPIALVIPFPHGERLVGAPYIATPSLLRHLHIDPASIAAGTELLTSRTDHVVLGDPGPRPDRNRAPTSHVQRVDLPSYDSAPSSLVTEQALHQHGWIAARAGWLIESSKPLSAGQIAAARRAAAAVGLTIETRKGQDAMATVRTVATTIGGLLALAILAMTIGLIRGESASDLRTLTATGASSRTRRTVTASTAGALAALGVVLAVAGAYLALAAAFRSDLGQLVPLPFDQLLILAIGLPAVATAGGWLLAGREPATFSRQSLD